MGTLFPVFLTGNSDHHMSGNTSEPHISMEVSLLLSACVKNWVFLFWNVMYGNIFQKLLSVDLPLLPRLGQY